MLIKGNPMGRGVIMSQRLLDVLVAKGTITVDDRWQVYLLAEKYGRVYSSSEIDNLIRRAYSVYSQGATNAELKRVIENSKRKV